MVNIQDIRRTLEADFARYDQYIAATLKSDNPLLEEVTRYLLSKRGKQLRPLLVLLSAKMCHGITDKSIRTAVAMELLHTSSLIHDDVVDASPMRRGMQSIQDRWGNKVAVLVGDYLLAKVIQTISETYSHRVLDIVSQLGQSLSSGELLQLHANASMWIKEEQYFRIIEKKTAFLFASCMEAGAESSGCTMRQATALRTFGTHLGIGFQLQDDVLDYSDSDQLGKPTMNDIRDGKATLPLLIALQRAPQSERETIQHIAEQISQNPSLPDADSIEQQIKSFVLRYDGLHYARKKMYEHKQQAIDALQCFRESEAKTSLLQLLDYAINRQQ